jgi:uncharacterized repeat protein (TIGR01451 family)
MNKNMRLLASASLLAVAVLGATPALAADIATDAGTVISNQASVSYSVNSTSQTPVDSNASTFTVDRKVNLLVAASDAVTTTVAPGQTEVVTTFTVHNLSNQTLDFALAASQPTGGSAPNGGTDNFDVTSALIYADTNTNGQYDSGTDLQITYLDELAEDASRTVFVVATVPGGQVTSDIAVMYLKATAREGGGTSSQGAAITETSGANTSGVDTVFADTTAGPADSTRQGDHSASDDYTVAAASLTVTKTSTLISDPINNTTLPKMIPGAVVEYCVKVANGGTATATNVVISDTLPADTNFVAGSIIVDGDSSCANGSAGGSESGGVVTAPLSNIAASATRSARFRVTVR